MTIISEISKQFFVQGYLDPLPVFTEQQCQEFLYKVESIAKAQPPDWSKGHAAISRTFYEIGTHPAIVDVVTELLGGDVMLYGASIKSRGPGKAHAWHCDIESSVPSGKTVSIWIGLTNTNRDSSFVIIPYSHNFGVTVQEDRFRHAKDRDKVTDEDVIIWAKKHNKESHLVKPDLIDGQALFFDGRLWHSTYNHSNATRRAILLQYATPDTKIRIPVEKYLDWPFKQLETPKPPCIMIKGNDTFGVNRIVSAPKTDPRGSGAKLTSRAYALQIPIKLDEGTEWKPHHIFRGSTTHIRTLGCHAAVLAAGKSPHPPHRHKEEEIEMLLSGEVDLLLPDDPTLTEEKRRRLKPGQFVFYPSNFLHSLETVSKEPANYLMFKWHSDSINTDSPLTFGFFDAFYALSDLGAADVYRTRRIFEGPTDCVQKLHCHVTAMAPGAGYEPHVDDHDVAIVILEGAVETLGERVSPYSVIFYPAGEPHGMHNPGKTIAKYIVFAFYGGQTKRGNAFPNSRSVLSKLIDPLCWKRALQHHLRRLNKP